MALPRVPRERQTRVSGLSCGSFAVSTGVARWVRRWVQVVPQLDFPLRAQSYAPYHPSPTERGCMTTDLQCVHASTSAAGDGEGGRVGGYAGGAAGEGAGAAAG
jgi:hypothetical protein